MKTVDCAQSRAQQLAAIHELDLTWFEIWSSINKI